VATGIPASRSASRACCPTVLTGGTLVTTTFTFARCVSVLLSALMSRSVPSISRPLIPQGIRVQPEEPIRSERSSSFGRPSVSTKRCFNSVLPSNMPMANV